MIKNKLGLNTKIYARKCLVKEVSSQEARKFLEYNHLQGYANSKVRLGLYYNEELISLMTFSSSAYKLFTEYLTHRSAMLYALEKH